MSLALPPELLNVLGPDRHSDRERRPPGTKPKFVKLHPSDSGDGLDDVFFEDPATFVPPKNQFGEVLGWGVFPYDEAGYADWDMGRNLMRMMKYAHTYFTPDGSTPIPQRQFIDALIRKKEAALAKLELGDLQERDYILRISMVDIPLNVVEPKKMEKVFKRGAFGEELIYRRFKVSGAINLDTFQDKVVQPIMGWARNAHAFVFEDLKDGACYGPKDSRAIDMATHVDKVCYAYIDADKYTLAHLMQNAGEKAQYFYDFGDRWVHEIHVESILPKAESDGSVVVLDGRGMCPPEDGKGNRSWAGEIWKFKHGTIREQNEILRTTLSATNYKGKSFTRSEFDPVFFSVPKAQESVAAALSSPASVREGPKVFKTPTTLEGLRDIQEGRGERGMSGKPRKGQTVRNELQDDGLFYMSETVSERRDRVKQAVCAKCGSPHNLKACSGCRKIWYCGAEHQKLDWKTHKPECHAAHSK